MAAQINHTIDKQTRGVGGARSPNSNNFTWGQSPKLGAGAGKTFNGAAAAAAAAAAASGVENGDDKNMFIGLLDIFG